jgi:hypothetical protein
MRTRIVLLALAVSGCSPARPTAVAAPQPQDVRLTNSRDAVKGCTMLGVIDSGDKTNGGAVTQTPVERDHRRRLQNEAARLEANTVLVNEAPLGMSGQNSPGGTLLYGEAYRCSRSNPVRI